MKNKKDSKKNLLILAGIVAVGFVFMFLVIASPENKGIAKEKDRLEQAEKQVIDAIATGNTKLAKALLVQMRWQYEASTVGGIEEVNKLRQTWRNKRAEYLILIGENPEDYMINDGEGESKSLKDQWRELVGE